MSGGSAAFLSKALIAETASLYVHVPFCAGICDYCDFYSIPVQQNDSRMSAYVDQVLLDAKNFLAHCNVKRIPTVYIGGGTPSVLGASLITRLLRGISNLITTLTEAFAEAEITLEVNPESCDEEFLAAAKDSGVNRLSVGAQTFHEASRKAVHRPGNAKIVTETLKTVSRFFPNDFSVDLISGLPFQNEMILQHDIEKTVAEKPAHISLYALTLEPNTPLALRAKNRASLPPNDEADRLWVYGRDLLEELNFRQYEVSNFCIPEKKSKHNVRYWNMENWIGVGPAASGTIINDETGSGARFTNIASVDRWLERKQGETFFAEENLDTKTLIQEHFMMGFRLTRGPDAEIFRRRFRTGIEQIIPETIGRWRGKGLFSPDGIFLTKQGLLYLDAFLTDAFGELDAWSGREHN